MQVVLDKSSVMDMPEVLLEKVSVAALVNIISDQQSTILSLQEDMAILSATNKSQQELIREKC